jgi:hypothetical protein
MVDIHTDIQFIFYWIENYGYVTLKKLRLRISQCCIDTMSYVAQNQFLAVHKIYEPFHLIH